MTRRIIIAFLFFPGASAWAQTDTLYVADGMGSLYSVVGGSFTGAPQYFGYEQAIAVRGDIRTQNNFGGTGKQYDLTLGPLAGSYADPGVGPFYDGTTDGKHNYAMSQGDWWVYKMGRDWSDPKKLFYVGPVGGWGITWDGTDNSLWLTSQDGIVNYTMNGAPNQATIPEFGGWEGGLAWEPDTNTLWYSGHHSGGLQQIYKNDTFGQLYFPPWGIPQNGVGLEFDMEGVPAPGAAAVLGLGGIAAARRRRG